MADSCDRCDRSGRYGCSDTCLMISVFCSPAARSTTALATPPCVIIRYESRGVFQVIVVRTMYRPAGRPSNRNFPDPSAIVVLRAARKVWSFGELVNRRSDVPDFMYQSIANGVAGSSVTSLPDAVRALSEIVVR